MKLLPLLKYTLKSASYGIAVAVILLLTIPKLRNNNPYLQHLFAHSSNTDAPLSYAKAVNVAGPAVVNIYSEAIEANPNYYRQARKINKLGSGVIMTSNGYILTNLHVVQNADLIKVLLQNGVHYPAELIGYDRVTDLAVLKVRANNLPVIPQKSDQISAVGDVVLAIGNPFNLGQTVTQGIISATGRNGLSSTNYLEFLQMDAAINKGNSGGALVNTNGELVGINSREFTESNPQFKIQGIFFAVPYKLAAKVMQQIIENGRVVRGRLGITANTYLANIKGFVIEAIEPNSPALKAGLQPNDVVVQIGKTPIQSITQALDIVAETKPNSTIIFKIYRNKKQLNIPVNITEFILK
ncbi:MAG: trypsin-like peptidase domain-containing protein [Alteromonadaceae bacterium]|nr:trypsin-like peptidase domain-containing protein [Alteromonadaceae bacterium]